MHFSISCTLLLAAFSSAAPLLPRQSSSTRITPTYSNKLYEFAPLLAHSDGWGEVSQVVGQTPSKVYSLVAFQLPASSGEKTCSLRFAKPDIATGTLTLQVYDFIPDNGWSFDPLVAAWSRKTGRRGKSLATFKAGGRESLIYSFPCPAGGKLLNYELVPVGDVNMQWPITDPRGLWLEVAPKMTVSKIRIDSKDQVQAIEEMGSNGQGSMQFGEINRSAPGKTRTTLVGFIMPATDYTKRTCNLMFGNESSATGTKTFMVYDFVPDKGAQIFESFLVSWKDKRGVRKAQRATYKVGTKGSVMSFPCPAPGKGVNYELVPTKEAVNIKWNSREDKGGLWIDVV